MCVCVWQAQAGGGGAGTIKGCEQVGPSAQHIIRAQRLLLGVLRAACSNGSAQSAQPEPCNSSSQLGHACWAAAIRATWRLLSHDRAV